MENYHFTQDYIFLDAVNTDSVLVMGCVLVGLFILNAAMGHRPRSYYDPYWQQQQQMHLQQDIDRAHSFMSKVISTAIIIAFTLAFALLLLNSQDVADNNSPRKDEQYIRIIDS